MNKNIIEVGIGNVLEMFYDRMIEKTRSLWMAVFYWWCSELLSVV